VSHHNPQSKSKEEGEATGQLRNLNDAFDDLLEQLKAQGVSLVPAQNRSGAAGGQTECCSVLVNWKGTRGLLFFVPMDDNPDFSPRQLEVASYVVRGYRSKAIASALSIKESTVLSHIRRIYDRHGVGSRVELALKLLSQGLSTVATGHEMFEKALSFT
jgi:DNA-binding NarL/FixJ family response regulator